MLPNLQFDEARHEYRVAGERWPSVTEILDPLLELDGIPKELLEAARQFGTHVHSAVHLWNTDELDEESLDSNLAPYLAAWKSFITQTKAIVVLSELRVMHHSLEYAGTLDSIVEWDGMLHVLDVKTGAQIPKTVGPQTAAYLEAYKSQYGSQPGLRRLSPVRYCVHLHKTGEFGLRKLCDRADFHLFLSALNIHKWRARHAS